MTEFGYWLSSEEHRPLDLVRDAGGIRSYRVRIGARSLVVRKPAITIARSRLRGPVSIAAVDRAGNVGPALAIALSRLR